MSNDAADIREIYRLLFDLATGRRLLEPETSTHFNAFDEVRQRVYALSEMLRDLVLATGMVPPYAGIEHVSSYVFVLDADYRIVDLNVTAAERLGYTPADLRQRLFEALLSEDSVLEWQRLVSTSVDKTPLLVVVNLLFLANSGDKLPMLCTVCEAVFKDWIFVLSVEVHMVVPTALEDALEPFKKDAEVIEQVHAYILGHLDEALPSMSALSSTLGIESSRLRQGFKHYYGKSIYQYYQEARLKKGYHLILGTRLQLKDIAYQCGFSDYINFYKAFKKRYGMAPSELLRP